jgi:hypothetical protein
MKFTLLISLLSLFLMAAAHSGGGGGGSGCTATPAECECSGISTQQCSGVKRMKMFRKRWDFNDVTRQGLFTKLDVVDLIPTF